MRTNALLFDLDDTLIDTKKRHYNIVKDYISVYGMSLDFEEYLYLRRKNNWSNKQIIKHLYSLDEGEFSAFWKLNIENPKYFKFDTELVSHILLNELKAIGSYHFILLSLRSNVDSAILQFKSFDFSSSFNAYHFLKHADLNPKIEKIKYYKGLYQRVILISDSQDDYNAAMTAGAEFVGVQSGIYQLSSCEQFNNVNLFLKTLL